MMFKQYLRTAFFLFALLCLFGFSFPFAWLFQGGTGEEGSSSWINKEFRRIQTQMPSLNTSVLKLGLTAYSNAVKQGLGGKHILTIIDYSKPSSEKRLWVVDLKNNRVLMNTWVSHGRNSGGSMATSFSNQPGSLKSSVGLFLTDEPYEGGKGYSLRLRGLEKGINDNAYQRDIVIHGAWYVGPDVIRNSGQVGRSWGCPAVNPSLAKPLIDTIKNKTLVFVYYPDRQWIKHSVYLA